MKWNDIKEDENEILYVPLIHICIQEKKKSKNEKNANTH